MRPGWPPSNTFTSPRFTCCCRSPQDCWPRWQGPLLPVRRAETDAAQIRGTIGVYRRGRGVEPAVLFIFVLCRFTPGRFLSFYLSTSPPLTLSSFFHALA